MFDLHTPTPILTLTVIVILDLPLILTVTESDDPTLLQQFKLPMLRRGDGILTFEEMLTGLCDMATHKALESATTVGQMTEDPRTSKAEPFMYDWKGFTVRRRRMSK